MGDTEEARLAAAEAAIQRQEWTVARELMHQLACAVPQNKHYRAQLSFARAGELLATGDNARAREELERTLRLAPDHAEAAAMLQRAGRSSLIRWFRR